MLASNREDDLLSKLKSCIGSLKNDPAPYTQDARQIPSYATVKENYAGKDGYSTIKENYRPNVHQPNPSYPALSNKNASFATNYAERQPLTTSNMPPPTTYPQQPTYYHISTAQRYEPEVRLKTRNDDLRSYDTTPRKFDYTFEPRRVEREEKPNEANTGLEQPSRSRQDIRSEISRRYSVMNDRGDRPKYADPQATPSKQIPARNYQQQVEQRKELLEGVAVPFERRERTPQAPRDYLGSQRKDPALTARDPGRIKPAEPAVSARKPERPLMVAETLQRAYEEGGNANECSALTKLRKISELNEKINDRIRNIINVFEEHKR